MSHPPRSAVPLAHPVPLADPAPRAVPRPGVLAGARRIVVLRLDNAGDVVLTGPTLRALREAFPDTELVLVVSPQGAAAAELLPWVDEVVVWRALWQDTTGAMAFDPRREFDAIERLKAVRADAALILTSFSQTPFAPAYACYLAGIPTRVGHDELFGGGVLSHAVAGPAPDHQAERNLHLLRGVGIEPAAGDLEVRLPDAARERVGRWLQELSIVDGEPVVVAPGASCSARRYDPALFGDAAAKIRSRTGRPVIVVGIPDERPLAEAVLARVPGAIDLVGTTSLAESAAVIASAGVVLANNSLALHLAEAVRRPVVVAYAGTEREADWAPRVTRHTLLREETSCSPCRLFECPFDGHPCLAIPPARLVAAALELLRDGPGPLTARPTTTRPDRAATTV
jgi:ADP-heptose:LPS heptosyltransferase